MAEPFEKRILEIIPGALIWLTLILGILFSFIQPLWVIYFIIMFDLFWLLRLVYFTFYLLVSWMKFRKAIKANCLL